MRVLWKFLAAVLMALAIPIAAFAGQQIIYDTVPSPLPPNLPSQPYQAQATAEFGDLIQFGGSYRDLSSVTLVLSDWALYSSWATSGLPGVSASGFTVPLTLNLYNVSSTSPSEGTLPGSLFATDTITATIPWRPEASAGCGTAWRAADGNCYNGLSVPVTFDLTGVTVPDQIIYGLAFNTETWGAMPIGVDGPYDSLNFGLGTTGASVGTDVNPDSVYWNTDCACFLSAGGTPGVFAQDTGGWAPYTPAAQFDAVPEPSSMMLFGSGLLGLGLLGLVRRRRA